LKPAPRDQSHCIERGALQVDILERLCTPFGLIRFGVAPDHPEMKVMAPKFDALLQGDPKVRLLGNVEFGSDVSLAELRRRYAAVIFACGAEGDRMMGLPGEASTAGVHSARDFVAWYNGLPSHAHLDFGLEAVEDVVVVGQGNVALDVARVLLRPVDTLRETDICAHTLAQLERSVVRRVHVVGRRGPVQAAWTGKEVRELLTGIGAAVGFADGELATAEASAADAAEMKAD
jgi:NADPH-dependent glutamate synthase beta subunit-like oxidoreductase